MLVVVVVVVVVVEQTGFPTLNSSRVVVAELLHLIMVSTLVVAAVVIKAGID